MVSQISSPQEHVRSGGNGEEFQDEIERLFSSIPFTRHNQLVHQKSTRGGSIMSMSDTVKILSDTL